MLLSAKEATTARCLEARAAVDRHGPGRVFAPLLTRTEDGQGRGAGARDELFGHDPGPPSLPPLSTHTHQLELFELSFDEEPGGARPDRLVAVSGPPERAQRRTVQQIVVPVFSLPTLDDPVSQMVDQLVDVLKQFDFQVPEQDIDVPMIYSSLPESQLAEQLVEVPTIISFSSLQWTVEQKVGIPVVGGSGAGGGFSGFLPGQNYSMTAEQIVDNPVPRRSFSGDLQGFPPRTEFVEADCEQDR